MEEHHRSFGKKENFNYPERAVVLRPGPVHQARGLSRGTIFSKCPIARYRESIQMRAVNPYLKPFTGRQILL
jgi:hypothetical protein